MNLGANLKFSEHLGNKMYVENPVETNLEYYVDFFFFFKVLTGFVLTNVVTLVKH